MSGDKQTIGVYDAKVDDYVAITGEMAKDPQLKPFIESLPENAHVLDLGCGPGWAAKRMAQAGMTVTATDASAEMVALAGKIDGVNALQATFDDITGDAIYDGIWANFSLLHADRADMPRYLAALRRALKPGGLFHIGMKTGEGAKRDQIGRFYTFYTVQELNDLLQEAGFTPQSHVTGADKGLAGTIDPWVVILSRG